MKKRNHNGSAADIDELDNQIFRQMHPEGIADADAPKEEFLRLRQQQAIGYDGRFVWP